MGLKITLWTQASAEKEGCYRPVSWKLGLPGGGEYLAATEGRKEALNRV